MLRHREVGMQEMKADLGPWAYHGDTHVTNLQGLAMAEEMAVVTFEGESAVGTCQEHPKLQSLLFLPAKNVKLEKSLFRASRSRVPSQGLVPAPTAWAATPGNKLEMLILKFQTRLTKSKALVCNTVICVLISTTDDPEVLGFPLLDLSAW